MQVQDIGGSTEPAYPVNAVFVGGQYSSGTTVNNGYELLPRDTSDFVHITVTKWLTPTRVFRRRSFWKTTTRTRSIPQRHSVRIAEASRVTVKVYSVLGQEVATLVNGVQGASYYTVVWNGTNSRGNMASSGAILSYFRCSCGWKVTNVHASEEDDVDEVNVKQSC